MTIGDRIKARRLELNLSQEELALRLGYKSKSSINKIELGTQGLRQSKIAAIAKALDTSPSYIMGWLDEPSIPDGFEPVPEMDRLPLVGQIACGTPILAEQNVEDTVPVPRKWRANFVLKCKGDSMAPKIQDGDMVAIRKQPTVENGEIAAVRIENEATLKRVFVYADRMLLQPENPTFPPIMLVGEEMNRVSIEGLAVGLCRSL